MNDLLLSSFFVFTVHSKYAYIWHILSFKDLIWKMLNECSERVIQRIENNMKKLKMILKKSTKEFSSSSFCGIFVKSSQQLSV